MASSHNSDSSNNGRWAIVTGVGRGGIGYYTARGLANAGYNVVCAGRNPTYVYLMNMYTWF